MTSTWKFKLLENSVTLGITDLDERVSGCEVQLDKAKESLEYIREVRDDLQQFSMTEIRKEIVKDLSPKDFDKEKFMQKVKTKLADQNPEQRNEPPVYAQKMSLRLHELEQQLNGQKGQ